MSMDMISMLFLAMAVVQCFATVIAAIAASVIVYRMK